MTLIDFLSQFPDEESCKQKFKAYRDRVGVICPKCGGSSHFSSHTQREKVGGEVLPQVHIAIGNARRQLINVFHDIKPEFLQNYLDEFCYKFNRRYLGEILFGRLPMAYVTYRNKFGYKYGQLFVKKIKILKFFVSISYAVSFSG